MTDEPAVARATIHLPGVPLGSLVYIDLASEYIQDCLKAGFLVRVVDDDKPGDPEAEAGETG